MYRRFLVLFAIVLAAIAMAAIFAPQANASPPSDNTANFEVFYYNFIDAGGQECRREQTVAIRNATQIWNFYPANTSPVPGIVNTQNFMICWKAQIYIPTPGMWDVYTCNDDGMNVWLNDKIWMNAWYDQGPSPHGGSLEINQPGWYELKVKYYNRFNAGTAVVAWVLWGQPNPVPCPYNPNPPPPPTPVCPGCYPCQGCPPPTVAPPPICPGCQPCQGCTPCQYDPNCYNPPPPPPCPYDPSCNNLPPVPPPCANNPGCYNPPPPQPCAYTPGCYFPPPPPPQPQPGCWYRVRYGDTLYRIGLRFGASVWQLTVWNNLSNPNLIYVGMLLRVCP